MSVHIFGIRHHGPGSARSLLASLEALAPDAILVEGPPEAEALLPLALHPEIKPPVALLAYVPDEPQRAAFFPFAVYSPEWQAFHFGLERGLPVRLMDLPQKHWLALREEELDAGAPGGAEELPVRSEDPLDMLAQAGGFEDGENWWERLVEERAASHEVFGAILEAMSALRSAQIGAPRGGRLEELREAAMRLAIRDAQAEGRERIAVVCGAWHAPALGELPPAKADRDLLKGLPKVKVEMTWVPWTYGHLSRASGYGAGVASPGWYEHLWTAPHDTGARWLARVAHLLRGEDLDASAAQVIDALRLAEALAALRGRARPGLAEMNEAALTALCFGDTLPLAVIHKQLIVGERLGHIPADAPAMPLQQDLAGLQRRLRLPPEPDPRRYDLDLREPNDLARSALLHRLALLGIPWGQLERATGQKGTFHEVWTVQWQPAFAVAVIEAAVWGNTVAEAAGALARHQADKAGSLADLTALLDRVLLADLPDALGHVMERLQAETALSGDVAGLMDALPPLARALRYGTVRQTAGTANVDAAVIAAIVDGLVMRICIGLPLACASLDDDAARRMLERLEATHAGLGIIQRPELVAEWQRTLAVLAGQQGLHGLLAGRVNRLLMDQGALEPAEVARRLGLALGPANPPEQAAAWLEGLLRGSGLLLLHDEALWTIIDAWVADLPAGVFTAVLPLVRRTFSAFTAAERRQMGERAARGEARSRGLEAAAALDEERADRVLPLVTHLLGLADGLSDAAEA